jgi:hypothetical protein
MLHAWDAAGAKVDGLKWAAEGLKRMDRLREIEQEPNMPLAHLAREFNARGPAYNCLTACAASTQAIGEAFSILRRGDADVRVARSAVEVTRRSSRPDVSLGVQAWHESATGSAAQGFFTLGISVPWLNRENYRRDLQRDRLRLEAAQDQVEDARQQVRRDLHALLTRMESARREALLQRDTILPRTRQLEASMAAQWMSGRADLRDLLETRRQRADAEITEASAAAAYWSALAEVMLRCGLETFESAFAVEAPLPKPVSQ